MEFNGNPAKAPLWTKDFTIITVGSVISMLGNSLSGFALGLLILDYTGSTLYYAIYMAMYMLPRVVTPVIAGPLLDRFSRKKAIYTLDFISSGLYLILAGVLLTGWFNFAILAVGCLILGTIDSIYLVAYESLYPMLVSEGNFSKAYSVSSTLETLTMLMIPASALIYNLVGIAPLFAFNAVTYLIAAIMETRISANEKYVQTRSAEEDAQSVKPTLWGRFKTDLKEGMKYLISEKGLLAVAIYFTFSAFANGASSVITLPYFKGSFENGEYVYMIVWGMAMVGRVIGGGLHYRLKLPANAKYGVALAVYVIISLLEGSYLFLPRTAMMVMCFLTGILGVTSYNIRISATQSYVPDEKKGRFNGTFSMLNTVGLLIGELAAGALTELIPERAVLAIFMGICALAAVIFIGGGRKHVAKIYNRQM